MKFLVGNPWISDVPECCQNPNSSSTAANLGNQQSEDSYGSRKSCYATKIKI